MVVFVLVCALDCVAGVCGVPGVLTLCVVAWLVTGLGVALSTAERKHKESRMIRLVVKGTTTNILKVKPRDFQWKLCAKSRFPTFKCIFIYLFS